MPGIIMSETTMSTGCARHEFERLLPAFDKIHVPFAAHGPQLALQALQHLRLVIHE